MNTKLKIRQERINNIYGNEENSLKIKNYILAESFIQSDEEIKEELENTIFKEINFQIDLENLKVELENEYDSELVERVIKHYIFSLSRFMNKVHEYRLIISIHGAFYISIPNSIFNVRSKFLFTKHRFLLGRMKFQKIKKLLSKNKLNTQKYVQ